VSQLPFARSSARRRSPALATVSEMNCHPDWAVRTDAVLRLPVAAAFGLTFTALADGRAQAELAWRPEHSHTAGAFQANPIAALADSPASPCWQHGRHRRLHRQVPHRGPRGPPHRPRPRPAPRCGCGSRPTRGTAQRRSS